MKYCAYCGNELLDEAVICPKCGCATELLKKNETTETISKGDNNLIKTANVFIVIGCILTGVVTYFIGFAWTIPLTIVYFSKRKKNKPITTGFKICLLLLVSQIGGILLLCDKG